MRDWCINSSIGYINFIVYNHNGSIISLTGIGSTFLTMKFKVFFRSFFIFLLFLQLCSHPNERLKSVLLSDNKFQASRNITVPLIITSNTPCKFFLILELNRTEIFIPLSPLNSSSSNSQILVRSMTEHDKILIHVPPKFSYSKLSIDTEIYRKRRRATTRHERSLSSVHREVCGSKVNFDRAPPR